MTDEIEKVRKPKVEV